MDAVVDAEVREYSPVERTSQHSLQDLKGMEAIQTHLKKTVIWPFAHPAAAAEWHVDPPRGVLLHGPPGTGKSALADAIVAEIEKEGRKVKYLQETGTCLSSYLGETENNLRSLFKLAKENAPSVIFLDELDGLGKGRSKLGHSAAAMHTVLSTLLVEINDLPLGEVLVLAATNCVNMCDQALVRKGRIDEVIEVPAPGPLAREDILLHYFELKEKHVNPIFMLTLRESTEKMTGADLKALVNRICGKALDRGLPDGAWRHPMTDKEKAERREEVDNIRWDLDIQPALLEAQKKAQDDRRSGSRATRDMDSEDEPAALMEMEEDRDGLEEDEDEEGTNEKPKGAMWK